MGKRESQESLKRRSQGFLGEWESNIGGTFKRRLEKKKWTSWRRGMMNYWKREETTTWRQEQKDKSSEIWRFKQFMKWINTPTFDHHHHIHLWLQSLANGFLWVWFKCWYVNSRGGLTWFLTSTLRKLGMVLEFWSEDQFRLQRGFHYHIEFGTPLWGVCRSSFWEQKLYLYQMINKIMSSRGGNLIIILHGLWRKTPFCSQSALLRDLHHAPIIVVYTLPIEEKVKVSLYPTCTCLEGGEHQISWEKSSSSCERTPPDWSLRIRNIRFAQNHISS